MKYCREIKIRRERTNEIKRKEQTINNEFFKEYVTDFQSASETENA